MQAIVLRGKQDLRYETDYPKPTPGPGEVLLRITYTSICQTDIEMWQHGMFNRQGKPHIQGHEAAGVVVELGGGVDSIEHDTRVAIENVRTCGTCFYCRKGTAQLCENGRNFGFTDNGGLAEYAVWPANLCIPLPDNVSNEEAPLAEPTSVAIHAVHNAAVEVGDIAVVIGCGVVGLITLQVLKTAGTQVIAIDPREQSLTLAKQLGAIETLNPTKVDVSVLLPQIADQIRAGTYETSLLREGLRDASAAGQRPSRSTTPGATPTQRATKSSDDARSKRVDSDARPRANARPELKRDSDAEPGDKVTSATNADDGPPSQSERELEGASATRDQVTPVTPGAKRKTFIGPDVIIETAGAPGTALDAANWVRRGGKAVIVGFNHQDQTLNFGRAHMGEKTIMGSSATNTGDYQKAINLIANGSVNVTPLITALVPLERGIQDGFQRMLTPEKNVYRILVGNG
jgi:threonine dehydrogenase-like Zn-dependent dehydrogenase